MSSLLDQFNGGAPTPAPVTPPSAPAPLSAPVTDFFSTETKVRAKEAVQVTREQTQAVMEVVAQRASDTLTQAKVKVATVSKLPKAMGAGFACLVFVIAAAWWFTRTADPRPEPVTVTASTPAPVAPPPIATPVVVLPPVGVPVAPTPVTQEPLPPKSPTPEEISARWVQKSHAMKLTTKVTPKPKPQYEQDADSALNAWKEKH